MIEALRPLVELMGSYVESAVIIAGIIWGLVTIIKIFVPQRVIIIKEKE